MTWCGNSQRCWLHTNIYARMRRPLVPNTIQAVMYKVNSSGPAASLTPFEPDLVMQKKSLQHVEGFLLTIDSYWATKNLKAHPSLMQTRLLRIDWLLLSILTSASTDWWATSSSFLHIELARSKELFRCPSYRALSSFSRCWSLKAGPNTQIPVVFVSMSGWMCAHSRHLPLTMPKVVARNNGKTPRTLFMTPVSR